MMIEKSLANQYIEALQNELVQWRCAVAYLQKKGDGFFPSKNVNDAFKAAQEAKARYNHHIQEMQLNSESP